MKSITLLVSALILTGCMTVPQTRISVDPSTRSINVESPKDIELNGLHAQFIPTATGTVVTVTIESYTSKNNIEVLRAVANANAEQQRKGAELFGQLLDAAQ